MTKPKSDENCLICSYKKSCAMSTGQRYDTSGNWPESLPMPTDEDIEDMAELSERNTGSDFFKKE